jgi:hypothetical protein
MFLLTLVLWLPFSFKTTGLVEEWGVIRVMESGSQLFFITPDSVLGSHRMRPLEVFVHAVAHALDPDSFLFFNLFQLLFLFGKMAAVYWLVLQFLPQRRLLAFVAGVLFLVYPADRALFTFRAIHIQAAVCSYLLAVCFWIRFVRRPARAGWMYLAGAAVLLMFSLMTYQVALPLAILTPLAALAFVRASDRRLWIATAAWYAAIAIPVAYATWALRHGTGTTYEMGLVAASFPLADVMSAVRLAYERQVTGWAFAWGRVGLFSPLRADIIAGLAVFAATGAWVAREGRRDPAGRPASTRRYLIVAVVAAAIVAVGMAVFLAIPSHRRQDFRTYFLSMAGSAVVLALLLFWITRGAGRFRDAVFLTLAMPFVGLGYSYALQGHQYFVNASLVQQQILQDMVAAAPRLTPGSFVVFLDHTRAIEEEYVFSYGLYLDAAVNYTYADLSIGTGICPLAAGSALRTTCTFDASSIHITSSVNDMAVPYDRVVFLTNDVDDHFRLLTPSALALRHEVSGYDPQARIAGTVATPRAATMFSCEPALSCFREARGVVTSFNLPYAGPIGRGWRGADPDAGGGTVRWSATISPVININLASTADLALEFRVSDWSAPDVVDSLTLSVSGTTIPLTHEPAQPKGRLYRGVLPRELLARAGPRTQLVFHVNRLAPIPTAPDERVGIALSSLRIRPR